MRLKQNFHCILIMTEKSLTKWALLAYNLIYDICDRNRHIYPWYDFVCQVCIVLDIQDHDKQTIEMFSWGLQIWSL